MSLTIAICDNNQKDCKKLKNKLYTYCYNQSLPVSIEVFSNGNDFLESLHYNQFDIVFMDTCKDPNGQSGIDTIKAAQNGGNDYNAQTVFYSDSPEYAYDAFKLNATNYMVKPISTGDANESMNRCISKIDTTDLASNVIRVKTFLGIVPISVDNITYIQVENKICRIHTNDNNTFDTFSSLRNMSERLSASTFFRISRGYLVNMKFVKLFYFDHLVMQDGTEFSLSRSNRAKLKTDYMHFMFDRAVARE